VAKRKLSEEHHEEHMDETWLIPYSDLLTLLLALFIVLFASAQVDQKKFEQLAQSFNEAFKGDTSIFQSTRTPPKLTEAKPNKTEQTPTFISNDKSGQHKQEAAQLADIKAFLDKYVQDKGLSGSLETALTEDGLMIRIRDSALFPSGSAELLPESRVLALAIDKILLQVQQNIIISGYTDNIPINTYEFPTNWDLSSKRALNFMKFILSQDPQLKPEKFSAIGYGEYRPIVPNDTDVNRAKNRRVEIQIVRKYPSPIPQ